MLTVDSGEKRRRGTTTNKISQKKCQAQHGEGKCFLQQRQWKHLTTLEMSFEAVAFLLEIQLAVGLFLLLLFISISN